MPEGVGYGPQDQFKGSSKSLLQIGNRSYANSGRVDVDNNFTTLLEFRTGELPYKMSMEFTVVSDSGTATSDNYLFTLQLMDEYVGSWVTDNSATISLLMVPITFILPPFTKVRIQAANITDSSSNQVYAWMHGKRI